MMEYECFDFLPFGLDVQVSDLLDLLHCLDRIQTVEAFKHIPQRAGEKPKEKKKKKGKNMRYKGQSVKKPSLKTKI